LRAPARIPALRHLSALAALSSAVALAYANSFDGAFVVDSGSLIVENPVIHAATWSHVRFLLTRDYWQPMATDGLYRPITTLSYLTNYAVLGNADRPPGYHAVNLLLHLVCIGLAYALTWDVGRRLWPAIAAAALLGLHPVATEAVTYIVGRADLLAAAGVLGGLLCHIRSTGRGGGPWRLGLAAAAATAAFSKENGLVLLPILLAYDAIVVRRPFWRDYGVVLTVVAAYLAARWYVQSVGPPAAEISPVDNPLVEGGFWAARLTAFSVIGRQLWLLLFPTTLSADYSYRQIPVIGWPPEPGEVWGAAVAVLALVAIAWAVVRMRGAWPALVFFLVFYVLALLPTANLLVLVGSIMADRFLYLPMVGFAGSVALIADRAAGSDGRRRAVVSVVGLLALLACGWRTSLRNRDWATELTVWSSTVRASPRSAKAHKGYAVALNASDPAHARVDEAIAEEQRALAIRPDYVLAMVDLGSYYVIKGDTLAARKPGGELVATMPASIWYVWGGDVLERARALDRGGNPELYNNLALAYARLERFDLALEASRQARRLDPHNPSRYVDVSAVLCNLARWEDAAIALLEALAIRPDDPDIMSRLVEVYRRLDATGGAARGRLDLNDPVVRRHRCAAYRELAETYAQAGDFDAAADARRRAEAACTTPAP